MGKGFVEAEIMKTFLETDTLALLEHRDNTWSFKKNVLRSFFNHLSAKNIFFGSGTVFSMRFAA